MTEKKTRKAGFTHEGSLKPDDPICKVSRIDQIVSEYRDNRQGGFATVRAGDVFEAVAIAERLKVLGEAHWFRGQAKDWPKLAPTIWRLPPERVEDAKQQVARLAEWAHLTPGMEELSAAPDALLAVAQHYGVPTPFLDFTTEPRIAGFFATEGWSQDCVESVIICLDIEEARRRWQDVARERNLPVPELLTLDVPNLWRLEAQHGAFVWCPYDSLDVPFRLGRILFPAADSCGLARGLVYPQRESPLEQLLKQFFQAEANQGGLEPMIQYMEDRGIAFNKFQFRDEEYMAEAFVSPPDLHPSWKPESIRAWLALEREYWHDCAVGPEVLLEFVVEEPHLMAIRLAHRVIDICEHDPGLRSRSPKWTVTVPYIDDGVKESLRSALQHVWDGMTRLPYTVKEIALAMGTAAGLVVARALEGGGNEAAESFFGSGVIPIVIARSDSRSYARAWAASDAIRKSVRDDFKALLVPSKREDIFEEPFNLLMTARNPRLLFDFNRLTELFGSQIIPTQVALDDPHHATIFSPARVHVIGPV